MKVVKEPKKAKKLTVKEKKAVNDFQKQFKKYEDEYIKKYSIEQLVFQNGSALAMIYKEIQALNMHLVTLINKENEQKEHTQN